jgi:hypothetical protein
MKTCCYCAGTFEDDECRPYGIDCAETCYPCGMKPETKPTTDKMVNEAIDRALALGGPIMIGHHTGPMALPKDDVGNN